MTARKPPVRHKPGPKPANAVVPPAMTKEEREQRNYLIFARMLAGHSEREIGAAVGLTGQRVHQILQQELKNAARHHQLLTDEALNVFVSRIETLLKAVWPKVLKQDLKAVDMAQKLLAQQARLYDLEAARVVPPMPGEFSADNPANLDELTAFRMRRRPDAEAQ